MTRGQQTTTTWLRRTERRLIDRRAEAQLRSMGSGRDGRAAALVARAAIVLLCAPVHAVSVGSALSGLWLLAQAATWPERALGVVLLLVAVATRPSLPSMPKHLARLDSRSAPSLFGLVEDVAAATGAPVPTTILVRSDFNASATRVGWRRERVMTLGAALWVAESPQGRIATIAHELGHFAHGDLGQLAWVSAAVETLLHWYDIAGGHAVDVYYSDERFVEHYLLAPLRWLIVGYLFLICWVEAPSSQRQEYLADLDSAVAAGTDAAIYSLDTLLDRDAVETAVTRAAVHPARPDVWATVREAVAGRTRDTDVRRRGTGKAQRSRIDDSHPATPLRIRLLEARPSLPARVELTPEVEVAIDDELRGPLALAAKAAAERIRYRR